MSKEIEIGNVSINNDAKGLYYGKSITIDYNGPYLSMVHFDKVRDALKEILQKHGKLNENK